MIHVDHEHRELYAIFSRALPDDVFPHRNQRGLFGQQSHGINHNPPGNQAWRIRLLSALNDAVVADRFHRSIRIHDKRAWSAPTTAAPKHRSQQSRIHWQSPITMELDSLSNTEA